MVHTVLADSILPEYIACTSVSRTVLIVCSRLEREEADVAMRMMGAIEDLKKVQNLLNTDLQFLMSGAPTSGAT